MTDNIKNKIRFTNFILGLELPFFSILLYNMEYKVVDKGIDTLWTDGKNIKFTEKYAESISKELFCSLVLKILLHLSLKHRERARDKGIEKIKYAYSASLVVNNMIENELMKNSNLSDYITNEKVKGKLDSNLEIKTPYIQESLKGKSVEEVFSLLPPTEEINLGDIPDHMIGMLLNDPNFLTDEELMKVDERLLNAYNLHKNNNFGTIPSELERMITELMKPKIDWRSYLYRFLQKFPNDWCFINRDTRFIESDIVLPTLNGEKIKIAFAIDVSGSINEEELNSAMSECFSIFKQFGQVELYLFSFDADIHNPKVIHTKKELSDYKVIGGGGTDFIPIFKHLEEKNILDGVIVFTDGYGSFPSQTKVKNTLWLITTDVVAPFGQTVKYNLKK
jgi:predicted metal-dependent peptidase